MTLFYWCSVSYVKICYKTYKLLLLLSILIILLYRTIKNEVMTIETVINKEEHTVVKLTITGRDFMIHTEVSNQLGYVDKKLIKELRDVANELESNNIALKNDLENL